MSDDLFDTIVSLSKQRGFIVQSSEIYGGLSATYDYGPMGVELKRNVKEKWWQSMVYQNDDIVGLDASIMMHPETWDASGHTEAFNDPLIDDKASGHRYRADELIEDYIRDLREEGEEEHAKEVHERLVEALNAGDEMNDALHDIVMDEEIPAPESGAFDWTDVRQFNLMFETEMGPVDGQTVFLRPETAQGIFVNFHNAREPARLHVPFGVAQIGKAFRNEIVARQFVFRMREFEQMEMQYFVKPGTELDWYEQWKERRMAWHESLGIDPSNLRFHEHDQLSHYANAAVDIQYDFPIGWKELEGIHSRTDYDLSRHEEYSGKKMSYYDPWEEERYTPYVVETSTGLDRTLFMVLCDAYYEEEVKGDTRSVLQFHPEVAPVRAGIFPLTDKEGLPDIARDIEADLNQHFNVRYDDRGSMGKRYRRQDEAGTPFCITVDFDTLDDQTVTVRDRDTMEQDRVAIDQLATYIFDQTRTWEAKK
ncbi:glycine--tRNA ligase [Salinibacter altiplanensis]|uniref:glycine--tRNA ligase n=1 Tax=Salinibacter altiplanensis TaxID=1803181 RepID=UPI0018F8AC54|nr:glycine--tRNA ligase [Salinibacter altiplanensis]